MATPPDPEGASTGSGGSAASAAPTQWRTATDPASGRTYYYHTATRQTQWRKPLELATEAERQALLEKDAQQRAFFAAMEANILARAGAAEGGGAPGAAPEERPPAPDAAGGGSRPAAVARPTALMVRTISTMDAVVLKDLIESLPSSAAAGPALPPRPGPVRDRSRRASSSSSGGGPELLAIEEDRPAEAGGDGAPPDGTGDGDPPSAEELQVQESRAVVYGFLQSLQEREARRRQQHPWTSLRPAAADPEAPSESSTAATPAEDGDGYEDDDDDSAHRAARLIYPSLSGAGADPGPARRPNALSKQDSRLTRLSTSSESLALSALAEPSRGGRRRPASSASSLSAASSFEDSLGDDASAAVLFWDDTNGCISLGLEEEEVLALRHLAEAADQMLRLTDEEEDENNTGNADDYEYDKDSLLGAEFASDMFVAPESGALRTESAISDVSTDPSSSAEASETVVRVTDKPPLPRPISAPSSEIGGVAPTTGRPSMLCQRRNTCGTIHVSSTLSDPDKDATILCVCAVYRTHILQSTLDPADQGPGPEEYAIFNDLDVMQRRGARVEFRHELPSGPPTLEEVSSFYRDVYRRAKMEADCIIMSLIYVERLIKKTNGALRPRPGNWRSILFACMVLSSKVWDDLSMWNGDFSQTCPAGIRFPLQRINQLEVAVLACLEFNVKVKAGEYAKYYFLLHTMVIKSGLGGFDLKTMLPLDVEGAKRLQHVSSQFQNEKARIQHYRSKSMGMISMPSSMGESDAKPFSKAGLEQIVKM